MRDVAFDLGIGFDKGIQSSVALSSDGLVVEVHRSQVKGDSRLFYNFGRLDVGHIDFQFGARRYGNGARPRVAVKGDVFVEVHEVVDDKGNPTNRLAYYTATIENNAVRLRVGPSDYGGGRHPAVAMNRNGDVIGFEQDGDGNLGYRIGRIAADFTLSNWSQRQEFPGRGIFPSVAIDSAGYIVVFYQDTDAIRTYTWVGRLLPGTSTVRWAEARASFDSNLLPSVALTDDGLVLLSFLFGARELAGTRTAVLDRDKLALKVNFSVVHQLRVTSTYNATVQGSVSVATNGNVAVQTFSNDKYDIGYASSLLRDRARWMSSDLQRYGKVPLESFVVPGSHDAGTYVIRDCSFLGRECNSKTQDVSYIDQLNAGVRYFDVRPVLYKGNLETGHFGDISDSLDIIEVLVPIIAILRRAGEFASNQGCDAVSLNDVLTAVRRFMETRSGELVVLKFSHYLDRDKDVGKFDGATMKRLTDAVVAALGPYLYFHTPGSDPFTNRIAQMPLDAIIGGGGKVLPLFDVEGSGGGALPPGLYRYRDLKRDSNPPILTSSSSEQERRSVFASTDFLVYDNYANKNELTELKTDQLQKLADVQNHIGEWFLFSWTLTQDIPQQVLCTTDIPTLAARADVALAENVTRVYRNRDIRDDRLTNIIYADRVGGFLSDVVIWLNERRTLGNALQSSTRDYLGPGDQIVSNNAKYSLRYEPNGDLVVAQPTSANTRSVSKTAGKAAWRGIMQEDGDFVIYSEPFTAVFRSNTAGHPGARLEIRDDGTPAILDQNSQVIPSAFGGR